MLNKPKGTVDDEIYFSLIDRISNMKTDACDSRNDLELNNNSRFFNVTNGRGDIVIFESLRLSLADWIVSNRCGAPLA